MFQGLTKTREGNWFDIVF